MDIIKYLKALGISCSQANDGTAVVVMPFYIIIGTTSKYEKYFEILKTDRACFFSEVTGHYYFLTQEARLTARKRIEAYSKRIKTLPPEFNKPTITFEDRPAILLRKDDEQSFLNFIKYSLNIGKDEDFGIIAQSDLLENSVPTFENFVNENESHDESLRKAFSIIKAFGPATVISDETIEVPGHRIEAFGPNNRKILADILNEVNPIIIGEYDEQNTHTVWIRDISDFDKMYELIVSKLSEISISKRPWNKNEIWIKGANNVFFTFNSNLTSISLSRDWALSYANELLKRIGASDDEVDSIGAIGTIFENEEQSSEEIVRILNTLGLKCELTSSGDYYRIHNRFWVLYWESTFDNDFLNSLVLNDQESNYIFKKAISHSFFSYSKESLVSLVDRFNRDLGTNMRFDKRTEELYMSSNLIGGLVSHNSSILVRAQDLPGVLRITLNKLGIDKGSDEYLGLDASSILTEEKTGSDELDGIIAQDTILENRVPTFSSWITLLSK